jgi:tryptophan synthase alpha chain
VSAIADGVIVGSAIVKHIAAGQQQEGMVASVSDFVHRLKSAMARPVA